MTATFNNALWQKSRLDRAERMDIASARRLVGAGHIERVSKPGKWRVFMDGDTVTTEVFGD